MSNYVLTMYIQLYLGQNQEMEELAKYRADQSSNKAFEEDRLSEKARQCRMTDTCNHMLLFSRESTCCGFRYVSIDVAHLRNVEWTFSFFFT